jgi:predicted aspartyl protease
VQTVVVNGRIDEQGRVLLPVSLVASDGQEVEVEATINLEFGGALAIPQDLAVEIGWRSLGGRRVIVGNQSCLMDHYIGMVAIGREPQNMVVLGTESKNVVIGQSLLAGSRLTLDFAANKIILE